MSRQILVVDDDEYVRNALARALRDDETDVRTAGSGPSALSAIAASQPHVVLSDVRMPDMDGIDLLRILGERAPEIDVVLMTGFNDLPTIALAMQEGAAGFLVKPMDVSQLKAVMDKVFEDRKHRGTSHSAPDPQPDTEQALVGRDPHMVEVFKIVGQVGPTNAGVLIRGESGVGKELVARTIHARSAAAGQPFVAVNCAALPQSLLESELFGHVRGAFTGAHSNRKGRFALAGRGTVFLDEIGDTSPDFQAKLLRVLQEREYYPVGADDPEQLHARILSATHRDLEGMIGDGSFRQDLYYRLRVVEVRIPPLRNRLADIPALAEHLVAKASRAAGVRTKTLAPETRDALTRHTWPGNVRELENCITRAVVMTSGEVIRPSALMLSPETIRKDEPYRLGPLAQVEADHVQRVLKATGGHKARAADILEVSRPRLNRIIERHGLTLP